jgi:mRNA interferase YafQ
MKKIKFSSGFKKDLKLMIKRGKNPNKIEEIIKFLHLGQNLPSKYKDHKLIGNFFGCRDCHLEPDWIVIYRSLENEIIFERTGTHSDLFKK